MMKHASSTLPDDRPITAISVLEDAERCPAGYSVIARTHDTDADADLWKETKFFLGKITRYLCISKVEHISNYFLQDLIIVGEKESPPAGFVLIHKTLDSEQRAWRKKQICYRLTRHGNCSSYVTDMLMLAKSKTPPDGFELLGEINGLTVCYKLATGKTLSQFIESPIQLSPYPLTDPSSNCKSFELVSYSTPKLNGIEQKETRQQDKKLSPVEHPKSANTSFPGIQGVPFILNPRLQAIPKSTLEPISIMRRKTREEINKEYNFEFDFHL